MEGCARLCITACVGNALTSAMSGVSRGCEPRETQAGSCTGRHVGGQDVIRVTVQVVAGPVIPHRGAGIGVAGGDLHVAQVSASVETGREQCSNPVEYPRRS